MRTITIKNTFIQGIFCIFFLLSTVAYADAKNVMNDAAITTKIRATLVSDPILSNLGISIRTNQGVVKISGKIDSSTQLDHLIEVAEATDGVRDVDVSKVQVKGSQQPVKDAMITTKIKASFLKEKVFGGSTLSALSVKVATNNGKVILTGTANNQAQIDNAIAIAKSVRGVDAVDSNVQIQE